MDPLTRLVLLVSLTGAVCGAAMLVALFFSPRLQKSRRFQLAASAVFFISLLLLTWHALRIDVLEL